MTWLRTDCWQKIVSQRSWWTEQHDLSGGLQTEKALADPSDVVSHRDAAFAQFSLGPYIWISLGRVLSALSGWSLVPVIRVALVFEMAPVLSLHLDHDVEEGARRHQ